MLTLNERPSQQANDTSRNINNVARMRNQSITTRTGALQPLVHPITGLSFVQWLGAAPNPQPNWQNWQTWRFPQDMAAVYAIQRSKRLCSAIDDTLLLITHRT